MADGHKFSVFKSW